MRTKRLLEFGPFTLDVAEQLLFAAGEPVALTPKALQTLALLVENSGRVLEKDELLRTIWPDTFVEEANLAVTISMVRKALGGNEYIETVPRRGYRFCAPVTERTQEVPGLVLRERTRSEVVIEEVDTSDAAQPRGGTTDLTRRRSPVDVVPETRYARSGDLNIAYQVVGDGPLDLVFVMGWVSHLEYFWKEPSFARFLHRLASFSRLILFDKRGTGLSDRVPLNELPTLEQRMDDVRAVMDAVGSERAALCGVSEGGPMCSLFAATYPEKTVALVMIGTYAKRIWDHDYPWAPKLEERREFLQELQHAWGGPVGLAERAPSVAHDPQFSDWWATYLRMGASPGAAVALTRMNAEIDVRHVLPTIRIPSLVIHRSGDQCLKVEEGRYVARQIPGARFVELPGADHLPFVGDQEEITGEIERFLTGVRDTLVPDTILATVLCAQLASSDETAAVASPDSKETSARYNAMVERQVAWFRGRLSDHVTDGVIAIFDGPVRAIRCACAINDSALRLGLKIKTGLHTGECAAVHQSVRGPAVAFCHEVVSAAEPGEVLVSSTVKDLVAGSGIDFVDRTPPGEHSVPGNWRLFAARTAGCGA
ncbi:MAG TPA: alpha/beta fold hydrolase [Blastocatellia bacterium]|nr:alpha/beta fold hydrolase [Blastocatellia bacterium]